MSKDNKDFFVKKSNWAKLKDDLLGHYLAPYLQKILSTNHPLLYIDGFAGKGMFDDGNAGSPVIACQCIGEALQKTKTGNRNVKALFVERSHAEELAVNVSEYRFARAEQGEYGDLAEKLSSCVPGACNLFLYVDPYGVKHLDQEFFMNLGYRYSSVELLINFNSFGFLRAACSARDLRCRDIEDSDPYLLERDDGGDESSEESIAKLDRVYGGGEWRAVVEEYSQGLIDGYEAESRLAAGYCEKLRLSYRFVQNLPIRIREHHHPKYRMIHATNHKDGCLLMYDQMQKRLVDMKWIQHGGQQQLFASDDAGVIIDDRDVMDRLALLIREQQEYVQLEDLLAGFVAREGLSLPLKDIRGIVRNLERAGAIDVRRYPAMTEKGRKSTFMESDGTGKKIEVRRRHA